MVATSIFSFFHDIFNTFDHLAHEYNRFLSNPLPDNKILVWSKLKQIADDILKCIWNEK